MSDDKKAEVIRAAQVILTDQLSNVITDHEALNRLHGLLDGPQTREAMKGIDLASTSVGALPTTTSVVRVASLEGADLDRYVELCETLRRGDTVVQLSKVVPAYSREWGHGGPIIERERIELAPRTANEGWWAALPGRDKSLTVSRMSLVVMSGPTPLIAAMRCLLASKFGETVPREGV